MALSNPKGIFHDAGCNRTTSGISWRVDVLSGIDSVSYFHTEPLLHDDASDDDVVVLSYNSLPCVSQFHDFPVSLLPVRLSQTALDPACRTTSFCELRIVIVPGLPMVPELPDLQHTTP